MPFNVRTDLASEARELWQKSAGETNELAGVKAQYEMINGLKATTVEILDKQGSDTLCKPVGKYFTLFLDKLRRREENAFSDAAMALSSLLRRFAIPEDGDAVVACLGNRAITPDALGPLCGDSVLVTRHLKRSLPESFAGFRSVAVIRPGVLAATGIESAENVKAFCGQVQPSCVFVVDALASASLERLGTTIQLADSGIAPGSGVGNDRAAMNSDYLGVPVFAVGVPTVVDASAFSDAEFAKGMFVTPRSIDELVRGAAKLIGYAINLTLHPGITMADIDMLLE